MKWCAGQRLKVLSFDLENRPLSYLGHDFTTAEITAIACSWTDKERVEAWLLGVQDEKAILTKFVERYNAADVVTGHFIRKHDLPLINGALLEQGLRPLRPKLVSDTYVDLVKRSGISASQENLAGMFGLKHPKQHMTQVQWREANRLTPKGIRETRRRVVGDVRQHKELRARLIEAGVLGPPRMWSP